MEVPALEPIFQRGFFNRRDCFSVQNSQNLFTNDFAVLAVLLSLPVLVIPFYSGGTVSAEQIFTDFTLPELTRELNLSTFTSSSMVTQVGNEHRWRRTAGLAIVILEDMFNQSDDKNIRICRFLFRASRENYFCTLVYVVMKFRKRLFREPDLCGDLVFDFSFAHYRELFSLYSGKESSLNWRMISSIWLGIYRYLVCLSSITEFLARYLLRKNT